MNCDIGKEKLMSRSNYDKPFYVDVGTSIVAIRCASNRDVVVENDHTLHPYIIELTEKTCDRMNKEAEIGRPLRNCDMPLFVDGPADNNADKAWLVFKHHNPDAYFDVPRLLRCIDWLLATANPKKKGEDNGSK